jgi:hypothetical protein
MGYYNSAINKQTGSSCGPVSLPLFAISAIDTHKKGLLQEPLTTSAMPIILLLLSSPPLSGCLLFGCCTLGLRRGLFCGRTLGCGLGSALFLGSGFFFSRLLRGALFGGACGGH